MGEISDGTVCETQSDRLLDRPGGLWNRIDLPQMRNERYKEYEPRAQEEPVQRFTAP